MAEEHNESEPEEEFFDWDDLVRLAEKEKKEDEKLERKKQEREERSARLEMYDPEE